jgi:hypothetical protein
MGEGSEGIAASRGSENYGPGSSREARHVGISPQEDRCGTKGTVGEGEGGEEGGVASWEPAAKMRQAFVLAVDCSMPCFKFVLYLGCNSEAQK